ncbi:hypothetical protein [Streptomyces lancefieldiae]|uniref:Integral membrane protein n=1 Tax=Streptomyces lancefieldiae TaxID=3075520 RepID=A0ABU3AWS5_9ACTN|nr:hypothetical protein [Streptomyces sp. DSM 40712]MDT0614373.1 hypothetical protein [Streptomyces sp. DSM 40712]
MLGVSGAFVLWLIQIVGTWVLVGLTVVALFLRTSFSLFALARTIVTAAVVLTLAYRYGLATDGFFGWVDAVIVKYGLMAIVTSIVLVVLAGVYVLVVPPGRRRPRLVRLFLINGEEFTAPGPLSVLALAGATTGVVAWSMNAIEEYDNAFVSLVTAILVLLPAGIFLFFAPLSLAGTIFNAANAHPALPSLAAPFVTVGAIVMDRFSGKIIATPDNLKDPFALTGLLITVILSAVELVRLRGRGQGLTRDAEAGGEPSPIPIDETESGAPAPR